MADLREPESESTELRSRINPVVFFGSAIAIFAFALWAIFFPDGASGAIGVAVGWISNWFGWFYILIATVVLIFVVVLAPLPVR